MLPYDTEFAAISCNSLIVVCIIFNYEITIAKGDLHFLLKSFLFLQNDE